MQYSRFKTLLLGLAAGVGYAFIAMILVGFGALDVSITYILIVPIILGIIPVLFSTKEQLQTYKTYLLLPWASVLVFFSLCFVTGFEGMICLVIIVAPFVLLGSLGAFIARLIKLKNEGNGTKLYISLTVPLLFFIVELNYRTEDQLYTVTTRTEVNANKSTVWANIKNVRNINAEEIQLHFIHLVGIPKPLDGHLNKDGVGGTRRITWERGIKFEESIKTWDEGKGFTYDINVDPNSIPPTTLDDHVMIGGKYFDVVEGGYKIDSLSKSKTLVTLTCKYRVSTNINFYAKWWADFILNDFNEMILEVIMQRSQTQFREKNVS
jgi:hypothetical protein